MTPGSAHEATKADHHDWRNILVWTLGLPSHVGLPRSPLHIVLFASKSAEQDNSLGPLLLEGPSTYKRAIDVGKVSPRKRGDSVCAQSCSFVRGFGSRTAGCSLSTPTQTAPYTDRCASLFSGTRLKHNFPVHGGQPPTTLIRTCR